MEIEFRFILAVLACFRLAELVAIDDGPGDAFLRFRLWCARHSKNLSEFMKCPYCLSLWFAIPMIFCVLVSSPVTDLILIGLGIAGGQAFLQGIAGRENNDQ